MKTRKNILKTNDLDRKLKSFIKRKEEENLALKKLLIALDQAKLTARIGKYK